MAAERSQISIDEDIRIEQLQKKARWQRAQLREDLSELRFGLHQAFDAKARKYFWQIAGTICVIGLIAGYWFAGLFSRKK
jgi:hypothetical protein